MSENLVEVKHLQQYFPAGGVGKNKRYVQAVDDVSFAIRNPVLSDSLATLTSLGIYGLASADGPGRRVRLR